eukprot:CCRYP_006457-RA/>CCRYP_006457-RA protein AED:0.46 eAED:0.46 QI:0/0/0/1/0/0/2/0/127
MKQKGKTGDRMQETKDQALETSCEEYLACFVLYKKLKDKLDNDFLKGKDTYPKKMEEALRLLQNHKGGKQREQRVALVKEHTGVAFAQQGSRVSSFREPQDISKDKCFNCGALGHHIVDCKDMSDEQ